MLHPAVIRASVLFTVGFGCSLMIDQMQNERGITRYPPTAFKFLTTATWVPLTCGTAAVLVGFIYPILDVFFARRILEQRLRSHRKPPQTAHAHAVAAAAAAARAAHAAAYAAVASHDDVDSPFDDFYPDGHHRCERSSPQPLAASSSVPTTTSVPRTSRNQRHSRRQYSSSCSRESHGPSDRIPSFSKPHITSSKGTTSGEVPTDDSTPSIVLGVTRSSSQSRATIASSTSRRRGRQLPSPRARSQDDCLVTDCSDGESIVFAPTGMIFSKHSSDSEDGNRAISVDGRQRYTLIPNESSDESVYQPPLSTDIATSIDSKSMCSFAVSRSSSDDEDSDADPGKGFSTQEVRRNMLRSGWEAKHQSLRERRLRGRGYSYTTDVESLPRISQRYQYNQERESYQQQTHNYNYHNQNQHHDLYHQQQELEQQQQYHRLQQQRQRHLHQQRQQQQQQFMFSDDSDLNSRPEFSDVAAQHSRASSILSAATFAGDIWDSSSRFQEWYDDWLSPYDDLENMNAAPKYLRSYEEYLETLERSRREFTTCTLHSLLKMANHDWPSVVRCFGCFLGFNYAAAKLPWINSVQLSVTLAIFAVILWYWFDRTVHGFVFAFVIAITGTWMAQILVSSGAYSFTKADFLGVRSWFPAIMYSAGVCFGSMGRQLEFEFGM